MINKNFQIIHNSYPFPHIKIKNFLDHNFYKELESTFPTLRDFKQVKRSFKRMDYDTTYGDDLYNNLIEKNLNFREFHNYVYSDDFISFFINLFSKDINDEIEKGFLKKDINIHKYRPQPFETDGIISKSTFKQTNQNFLYPRLDIGTGIKGYGEKTGGGGIHIDNPQRLISFLFYIGGFKKIIGGEHRIWKRNKSKDNLQLHESIQPEKNLLVAGLQTNLAYHDVNPVIDIDGSRNAFYMAISSSVPIWKEVNHSKFNKKFNKNRVKLSLFKKIKKFLSKLVNE